MTRGAQRSRRRRRASYSALAALVLLPSALYVFRGPLLLEQVRTSVTATLSRALGTPVRCARISGDPMGRVVLHELSVDPRAHGLELRGVDLTLDLDAFAWSRGEDLDAVERIEIRVAQASVLDAARRSGPRASSASAASPRAPADDSPPWKGFLSAARAGITVHVGALRLPGLPEGIDARLDWGPLGADGAREGTLRLGSNHATLRAHEGGLRVDARDFALGDAGELRFARGALSCSRFQIGETWSTSRVRGHVELEGASWRGCAVAQLSAELNWQNAELELRKFDARGVRDARSDVACAARGKLRLDLPRGKARRVARVHWNLRGEASPSALAVTRAFWPRTPASGFTSHGSVKLPIAYGADEEYLAGTMNLEMKALHPRGFAAPLHLRCHADIDGMGLLVFRRVYLRQGGEDAIRVVGRYPLHRYGRPDLRVAVAIDELEPWLAPLRRDPRARAVASSWLDASKLHGELKLRGDKEKPRVRLRGRADVPLGVALGAAAGTPLARALPTSSTLTLDVRGDGSLRAPELAIAGTSAHVDFLALGRAPLGIFPGKRWSDPLLRVRHVPATSLPILTRVQTPRAGSLLIAAELRADACVLRAWVPCAR